jgi:hypothetical protein
MFRGDCNIGLGGFNLGGTSASAYLLSACLPWLKMYWLNGLYLDGGFGDYRPRSSRFSSSKRNSPVLCLFQSLEKERNRKRSSNHTSLRISTSTWEKQLGCLWRIWVYEISFFVRHPELGWAGVSCGWFVPSFPWFFPELGWSYTSPPYSLRGPF